MLIEIDIKINENNSNVKADYNDDTEIEFNLFLSKCLSYSGYLLREKLFQGYYSELKRDGKKSRKNRLSTQNNTKEVTRLEDSELEYRIRIGDNKVLVGKIPLKLNSDTKNVTLLINSDEAASSVNVIQKSNIPATAANHGNLDYDIVNDLSSDTNINLNDYIVNTLNHDSLSNSNSDFTINYDSETENTLDPDMDVNVNSDLEINKIPDTKNNPNPDMETRDAEYYLDYDLENNLKNDVENNLDNDLENDLDHESESLEYLAEEAEIGSILKFSMIKAIEKYEANLSPSWDETAYSSIEPALDEY